jgi:hypothetical protein
MRFLLIGIVVAAGAACGPLSSQLPGGSWNAEDFDASSSGGGGEGSDGSTSGTPPATAADAGIAPGAQDGSTAGDANGDAGPVDAGSGLDTGSALTTFTLLDTNVNTIVDGEPVSGWDPIPEQSTLDEAKVGTALSIRANTTPTTVGSVGFLLDGVTAHTENSAPYTECSDNGAGTITPCVYTLGPHVLVVTPYTAADLGGTAMPSTTLYFTLVDTATDGGMEGGMMEAGADAVSVVITP